MIASALLAFAHHVAAFTLVAALVGEYLLFTPAPGGPAVTRLGRLDAVYGASAGMLLAIGLIRVFVFEKGAAFYFENGFFLAKLALFVALGLVSIYPTRVFRSWRAELRAGRSPALDAARARRVLIAFRIQLAGIAGLLLCAALMAKGVDTPR